MKKLLLWVITSAVLVACGQSQEQKAEVLIKAITSQLAQISNKK